MRDMSWPLLAAGMVRVIIWWAGALLAYNRKRYLLATGFGLAGVTACVFAFGNAHGDIPTPIVELAAYAATPVVGLIVMSFIANQPKGLRPDRWSP